MELVWETGTGLGYGQIRVKPKLLRRTVAGLLNVILRSTMAHGFFCNMSGTNSFEQLLDLGKRVSANEVNDGGSAPMNW